MNFALNILYLEAQFFSFAITGQSVASASLPGTGTIGAATGGRQVAFSTSGNAERAREIYYDTLGQIALFRELLGSEAVAQPAINLAGAGGPFGTIGRLVSDAAFDPYANELQMFLAAFYLVEPSLSMLKRMAWQITTKQLADAVSAVVAAKAGHAAMIRLPLIRGNFSVLNGLSISLWAMRMSDLREEVSNTPDTDDGTTKVGVGFVFFPISAAGDFPERTPAQTRSIYTLAAPAVRSGGFFPNGMNGMLGQ